MQHLGKAQIEVSNKIIGKATLLANQQINSFKQKNEKIQKQSRILDQSKRQERFTKIQEESASSTRNYTALEMMYSQLKQEEDCQKLDRQIKQQKKKFQEIANGKKKIIHEFKEELQKKDDEYMKALKGYAKDIKDMIASMRDQFFKLRNQNKEQLKQIQKKFDQERKIYISKMIKKVDDLFNKHIKMQSDTAEKRRKGEDDFVTNIDNLRIQGSKQYAESKIKIEKQIQNLQKCYQQMRALYQLNTQKLQYNVKVLKVKNLENKANEQLFKKKNTALNNKLRKLKLDYQQSNAKFKKDNKQFTEEYKKLTKKFKDLQKKFKHFQKADLDRYSQIQAMNQKQVAELKNKIKACDKTIHIQQLGIQWLGNPQKQEKQQKQKQSIINTQEVKEEEISLVISQEKLSQVLDICIIQADFMFDDKMRQQLQGKPNAIKIQSKLELLKKSLQIDSVEELNMFFEEIASKCHYISEKKKKQIEEQNQKEKQQKQQEQRQLKKKKKVEVKQEQKKDQTTVVQQQKIDVKSDFKVQPTMVVDFLNYWMKTMEERKKYLQKHAKKSAKQLSERQKKQMIARQGKKYWEKMTLVLPKRTFRIWNLLDKLLSKYHSILLQRHKLIEDTGQLNSQNEQLKTLLNQYLQINHELIIPPTRLIRID